MIYQFPVPHDDELLGSVLARFISRQGIREDKVALELLFGSRNIVPSALLQGHLSQLANNVQHLWPIAPNEMIEKHSILPIFKAFVEPDRYSSICSELSHDAKSHSMLKVGINASSLVFPTYFRFCPVCFNDTLKIASSGVVKLTFNGKAKATSQFFYNLTSETTEEKLKKAIIKSFLLIY